ncbi:Ig-like domain-containing protein [Vibrio metschnikovii]|nr:Ig-like domain-containing protein [Vibrio metschnikovii]EKO3609984.1 Ig-like domain-containing protein [Vibrio metschnikovii]EKO3682951.1 Ig-like domain-containing protein [Vibrio metschnikovii]EKO3713241.1 Ig-like domain-containing protein [Vibrio metschnikovii]EKO3738258.1 Ig-like domain-containing protein [Vibrio metschnikovii]
MIKFFKYLLVLTVLPSLILLSGCNSEDAFSGSVGPLEREVTLERIDIAAASLITRGVSGLTLASGNRQPFEAVGHFSDGSSRILTGLSVSDWHTSDEAIGFFYAPGILTAGNTPGIVAVHVSIDGIISNIVTVNVTAAVITDLQVTPSPVNVAKGQAQPLVAMATYSDATSSDVTSSVTWTVADTAIATVSPAGLLSAAEVGSTTLTATKDGVPSNTVDVNVSSAVITAIQVTPSPVNVAKGQTQPLVAMAIYSDGSNSDVTSSATWIVADTAIATVSPAGLLSAVEVGSTTLTAIKDGVPSNTVDVTVSPAFITEIQVTPSPVNVAKGQTQPLVAMATYSDSTSSDVSSSVTWAVVETAIATVSSTGLLSAVEVGSTTLTATKDGVPSNTVDVIVSPAVITEILVTPSSVNMAKGQTQPLVAIATYSDATSSEVSSSVTWAVTDTAIATVSSTGLLSAVDLGNATVTAIKDGVPSNTVSVNVYNLAGPVIDIVDTGSGKLFTNSPSVAYLDSIGGSATNGILSETGAYGPAGDFYAIDWYNANALCDTYNTHSLGGRTNWRLATIDELKTELYGTYGNMYFSRGWPTYADYWSTTPADGSKYYYYNLDYGVARQNEPSFDFTYASCVSEP